MKYEILTTAKSNAKDEEALRTALAEYRPGMTIEGIRLINDKWEVRLAEAPPFPPKKDESSGAPANLEEATDEPKEEEKEESGDEKDEGDKKEEKGDSKDDGEGDALGKLKELVGEMQSLFDELVNKSGELADDAQAKNDKIKEIHDTVKDDVVDTPAELGPTPGGPPVPADGAPAIPQGPRPARGLDKRKKPAPGGGVSTFTNRRSFIATHPGYDEQGSRLTMTAAARELEENEEWSAYEVVNIKAEGDTYIAKLQLKESDGSGEVSSR